MASIPFTTLACKGYRVSLGYKYTAEYWEAGQILKDQLFSQVMLIAFRRASF